MFLIIGLGNIGDKYENTRHNIGFKVIDKLIDDLKPIKSQKKEFKGELFKSDDILFLKPSTFMNLSGESAIVVKNFYKVDLENVIVIHDDLDLKFGALKFKNGGGSGGHNGLKSLDKHLGANYNRVRVGIGKPEFKNDVANFVLSNFNENEKTHIDKIVDKSTRATLALLDEPLSKIASKYSQKGVDLTLK